MVTVSHLTQPRPASIVPQPASPLLAAVRTSRHLKRTFPCLFSDSYPYLPLPFPYSHLPSSRAHQRSNAAPHRHRAPESDRILTLRFAAVRATSDFTPFLSRSRSRDHRIPLDHQFSRRLLPPSVVVLRLLSVTIGSEDDVPDRALCRPACRRTLDRPTDPHHPSLHRPRTRTTTKLTASPCHGRSSASSFDPLCPLLYPPSVRVRLEVDFALEEHQTVSLVLEIAKHRIAWQCPGFRSVIWPAWLIMPCHDDRQLLVRSRSCDRIS